MLIEKYNSWTEYNVNDRGWDNISFDFDFREITSYKIKLSPPKYINLDYRYEFLKTISGLPNNYKYSILFSGGYDSAITVFAFSLYNHLDYEICIGRLLFKDEVINSFEYEYAEKECKKYNMDYQVIDVDVHEFLEKSLYKDYYSVFPSWHIERYLQMLLIDFISKDNIIINSGVEFKLKRINKNWFLIDDSCDFYFCRYADFLKKKNIPDLLMCTPELGASLFLNPYIKLPLESGKYDSCSYDLYDWELKKEVYKHFFPEVEKRQKIIGTNKFENKEYLRLREEAHKWLSMQKGVYGFKRHIPYTDVVNQIWNKEYTN